VNLINFLDKLGKRQRQNKKYSQKYKLYQKNMFLLKSILLSFSLLPMPWAELDFSYLDYNFLQVIYCDASIDQVLEITNRTSSTICIENDSQSFIGGSSNQPNGDNS
jgi:hypothetical protein